MTGLKEKSEVTTPTGPKKVYRVKISSPYHDEPVRVKYFLTHHTEQDGKRSTETIAVTEDGPEAVSGIVFKSDAPGRRGLEWSKSKTDVRVLLLHTRGERMDISTHPSDDHLYGEPTV